jgi:acetyltransferase-like isoleucine patch superfamily enzyme
MNVDILLGKIRNLFFPYKPYILKSNELVTVGKLTAHNGNCTISGGQKVLIGNYCAIGKNVSIITSNHDYNYAALIGIFYNRYFDTRHPGAIQNPPTKERTKGPVIIGNDVWIADNVTILSGVTIGNGACIATSSVVTKNVDPYMIVGGIPAKPIKKRFSDEKISFLEQLKWWDWDEGKIHQHKTFFMSNINILSLEQIRQLIDHAPPPPMRELF